GVLRQEILQMEHVLAGGETRPADVSDPNVPSVRAGTKTMIDQVGPDLSGIQLRAFGRASTDREDPILSSVATEFRATNADRIDPVMGSSCNARNHRRGWLDGPVGTRDQHEITLARKAERP